MSEDYRVEHDSMGEVRVPKDALWRAQTQRAVENFPISGTPIEPALISAMARVKAAAATANEQLEVLTAQKAQAIRDAAATIVAPRTTASGRPSISIIPSRVGTPSCRSASVA